MNFPPYIKAATLAIALSAPSLAMAVPLAASIDSYFYSMQVHGISNGATSQTVGVHVFDSTYDSSTYGYLKVTNALTSALVFEQTFGDYGGYGATGTFDSSTFELDYGVAYTFNMAGQEFSNMSILFGADIVANGGTYFGVYPTFNLTETMANPNNVPEPGSLALLGLGLAGLAYSRKRKANSTAE